jgi:hypothetical protein
MIVFWFKAFLFPFLTSFRWSATASAFRFFSIPFSPVPIIFPALFNSFSVLPKRRSPSRAYDPTAILAMNVLGDCRCWRWLQAKRPTLNALSTSHDVAVYSERVSKVFNTKGRQKEKNPHLEWKECLRTCLQVRETGRAMKRRYDQSSS